MWVWGISLHLFGWASDSLSGTKKVATIILNPASMIESPTHFRKLQTLAKSCTMYVKVPEGLQYQGCLNFPGNPNISQGWKPLKRSPDILIPRGPQGGQCKGINWGAEKCLLLRRPSLGPVFRDFRRHQSSGVALNTPLRQDVYVPSWLGITVKTERCGREKNYFRLFYIKTKQTKTPRII